MREDFDYFAFISYKREDEKWARWLQNSLERYTLPSAIRREIPRLPKHVRPIFRDKTDLGAGMLTDSIHKELEHSRYLIVICSPRSKSSDWVGKEITAFAEMGRTDCIIPFIVEGTPNSNDEQECFHPVIKEKIPEALGINISEIGKEQAFVKVLARLLELRFDKLWNRFLRRQHQNRLMAAALSLLFLAGLGFIWDYSRTKVEYYADYVDRWGIPEGIVRLGKSQVLKRSSHYRFETSKRKLRRVVHANSAGRNIDVVNEEFPGRPSILELKYTDNRLITTELKNARNLTIASYSWGGANYDSIDIKAGSGEGSAMSLSESLTSTSFDLPDEAKADIKRFKLARNEHGYIVRREFRKHNGDDSVAACDANGVWGYEYETDSPGRVKKIKYLGFGSADYLPGGAGILGKKYEHDEYGNICKITFFGVNEKPVFNKKGWSVETRLSDSNGNIVENAFFDVDGAPCLNEYGFFRNIKKFDDRGFVVERATFDTGGEPCLMNEYGCAKISARYDKRGNSIELTLFGVDGKPSLDLKYCARTSFRYDRQDNIVEITFFGVDGKPCMNNDGYSSMAIESDKYSHIIKYAFFDVDGKPCLLGDGFSKIMFKYNDRGNCIEMAFFGIDDKPCLAVYGYSKTKMNFDDKGNFTGAAYFGTDDEPCLVDGHAVWERKFNERGYVTEESFFGVDGRPCLFNGYAKFTIKYDERGYETERAYYDTDGNPGTQNGYAKVVVKCDDRGNRIEEAYLDANGRPALHRDGYARLVFRYDEYGREIERIYFGINGKQLKNKVA